VSVNVSLVGPTELVAVTVNENVPVLVGVPESTPVELLKLTPCGSVPDSVNVGVGKPLALNWKFRAVLTTSDFELALVKAGFDQTPKLKVLVDVEPVMFESPP